MNDNLEIILYMSLAIFAISISAIIGQQSPESDLPAIGVLAGIVCMISSSLAIRIYDQGMKDAKKEDSDHEERN